MSVQKVLSWHTTWAGRLNSRQKICIATVPRWKEQVSPNKTDRIPPLQQKKYWLQDEMVMVHTVHTSPQKTAGNRQQDLSKNHHPSDACSISRKLDGGNSTVCRWPSKARVDFTGALPMSGSELYGLKWSVRWDVQGTMWSWDKSQRSFFLLSQGQTLKLQSTFSSDWNNSCFRLSAICVVFFHDGKAILAITLWLALIATWDFLHCGCVSLASQCCSHRMAIRTGAWW